jgi:glycosidase
LALSVISSNLVIRRGLRLIVDLPINDTSEQHPWFQQARCDPSSPFRDYYVWSKVEPENATDGVVMSARDRQARRRRPW